MAPKWILPILVLLVGLSSSSLAKRKRSQTPVVFSASFQALMANSAADTVAGATYTKNLANPFVAAVSLGVMAWKFLYAGIRSEYWIAQREVTISGTPRADRLKYQTIAPEIGFYYSNPRVILSATASAHYPLFLTVETTGGVTATFQNSTAPLTYQARGLVAIQFSSVHSFFLEGGYRLANLGRLAASGTDFIDNAGDLDLSGPFLGIGILFMF